MNVCKYENYDEAWSKFLAIAFNFDIYIDFFNKKICKKYLETCRFLSII